MLNLSRKRVSRMVWETLLETVPADRSPLHKADELESLRHVAQLNTGSMTKASLLALWSVVRAFKPKRVIEIGTFIGKSTYVLGLEGADIDTCDYSNDIALPHWAAVPGRVTQYPMTASADMMAQLTESYDLMFVDGRLNKDDLPHIGRLLTPTSIVAFDDFEGVEKGVANAMRFNCQGALLVYPAERVLTERYGIYDESTVGLIIPQTVVKLTSQ